MSNLKQIGYGSVSKRRMSRAFGTLDSEDAELAWAPAIRQLDAIKAKWPTTQRRYLVEDIRGIGARSLQLFQTVNGNINDAIDEVESFALLGSVADEMRKLRLGNKHLAILAKYNTATAGRNGWDEVDLIEFRGDMIFFFREALFNHAAMRKIVADRPALVSLFIGAANVVIGVLKAIYNLVVKVVEFTGKAVEAAGALIGAAGKGLGALTWVFRNIVPISIIGGGLYITGKVLLRRRRPYY